MVVCTLSCPKRSATRSGVQPISISKLAWVWDILRSIGNESIENEGRVYGGGLKKIEPKELAKVPCQALDFLC